jgi:CubicO group peptidase (beta-lactamase class C family)
VGALTVIDLAALERCVDAHVERDELSGIVCVARGGELLFQRAAGDRIKSEAIPIDAATRFPLASGSKLFTSIAIAQLVDDGRLRLDSPLADHLGGALPLLDPAITIEQLLRHTSGIRSYFDEELHGDYEAIWRDRPMYRFRQPRDLLPLLAGKPMKRPPGDRFEYNDGGYILLGLVIEQITGAAFADHVEEHVLRRAGMNGAGYFALDRLPANTAHAYIRDGAGWRSNIYAVPAQGQPDGGAFATAADLAHLWDALAGHRLLSPSMTARLSAAPTPTGLPAPHDHYGLGLWIERADGVDRQHAVEGSDPGVEMISGYFPASGLSLTFLGNTGSEPRPLYRALTQLLP